MLIVTSSSITYCTESPARMIMVLREGYPSDFPFNNPSVTIFWHRMIPVNTITDMIIDGLREFGWPVDR